jgi:outer membrane biosynthesis protein TonB
MPDVPQELQRLVPENLMVTFSRSRIFHCLLIAIGMHVVLMAATSVTYVRDTWIDPEGAARRKAEKLAAKKAEQEAAAAVTTQAAPTEKPSTSAQTEPPTSTTAAKTPAEAEMEKRKGAPVIQEITAKAKTSDIPKEPDGLGITIEETNP